MHRFMTNLKPPKARKSQTSDEKKQVQKKYDTTKRCRKFLHSWTDLHKWLSYDEGPEVMICKTCSEIEPESTEIWVTPGCTSFRKESIIAHEKSKRHLSNVSRLSAKLAPLGTSSSEKILITLNEKAIDKLSIQFRTAHSLAKHARPFTDFVWQCRLDAAKGLDIGDAYRTDKKCREFTDSIAEVERAKLQKTLETTHFIGISCDEATDSAVMEQAIIYVRHAENGVVTTDLLAVQTVERATAENIFDAIMAAFKEQCNLDPDDVYGKLVGFASDGASVMQGVRSGVAARFLSQKPKLKSTHCIAHRLELAIKVAIKNHPLFGMLDKLLLDLYLFYHNSTLNRGLLRRTAKALAVKKFTPTRTGGTRWIGHTQRALQNIISGYSAIFQHLLEIKDHPKTSKDTKGKSHGFVKKLMSTDVIEFGHFLLDLLAVLSKLSAKFQLRTLTIGDVQPSITDTLASLKKLKAGPGPNLRKYRLTPGEFNGQTLTGEPMDDTKMGKCIDELTECIEERFDPSLSKATEEQQRVDEAFTILDLDSWPVEKEDEFGDESVACLVDYYESQLASANISSNDIEVEWTTIKTRVYKEFKPVNKATWSAINSKHGLKCPNFCGLIDLCLAIPASSVECERGFSLMKKIKTDWRSSLDTDTLTGLMRIDLQSPDEEHFDPLPAIHHWNNLAKRKRRPFQAPYKKRKCMSNVSESEEVVMIDREPDESEGSDSDDVTGDDSDMDIIMSESLSDSKVIDDDPDLDIIMSESLSDSVINIQANSETDAGQ